MTVGGGFETLFKDEPKETNQHQLPTEQECVTSAMLCVCTQDNLHLTTAVINEAVFTSGLPRLVD